MTTQTDISNEDVKNFKALLTYFKRLSEDGVTPLIEKQLLLMLDHSLPFFSHLVQGHVFPEIHRITINKRVIGKNKRIRDINFLKYPPAEKVTKYGRCNLPNQSVFYASFSSMTTMSELKPRTGDLITETTWRVKDNRGLLYCPIFKNQPIAENFINPRTLEIERHYVRKLSEFPQNMRTQIDELVQFIADAFTKRVHPERHLDYIFSAYFSNKIFTEFENGKIEAIYYPSVQERLSFENIAIKKTAFDEKYELAEVKEGILIMDPSNGRGGYFSDGISDCTTFDYAKNLVLWDDNRVFQSPDRIKEFERQFGLDLT